MSIFWNRGPSSEQTPPKKLPKYRPCQVKLRASSGEASENSIVGIDPVKLREIRAIYALHRSEGPILVFGGRRGTRRLP